MPTNHEMSDDLEYGKYCAKCGQLMDCPPDLEPTPECNPCAQELLASLRSQLQQRDAQLAERDEAIREMRKQSDGLGLALSDEVAAKNEAVRQADEADGRLLALTEALEWAYSKVTPCKKPNYDWAKAHQNDTHAPGEVARKILHTDGEMCERVEALLSSTSSAAADARRRVEQQALREAAANLSYGANGNSQSSSAAWLFKRAESLSLPVQQTAEK